jgi:L-alanine-DL-glutamate epimerase-like enolase superfamily enzyme
LPTLVEARVALLEQPFPIGSEWLLADLDRPVPVAADESFQTLSDLPRLVGRFDIANIKLDKCGGLTEALKIVAQARCLGLRTMVGNMGGTSLSTRPAFVLGQQCDFIDLDGPLVLARDRLRTVRYEDGHLHCDEELGLPTLCHA